MLDKHLLQVQIKVKLSKEITGDEEIKIIDLIGERRSRLESVKDEITRLKNDESATIEERQNIIKKLKNEVTDAKTFLNKISLHVELRTLKRLIAQQEIASNKVERIISELDNANTETLNDLLSIMEGDLEEAKKYITLATEETDEDNALAVIEGNNMRNYLNRARIEVKSSYITLHKIVKILGQETGGVINPEKENLKVTIAIGEVKLVNLDDENINLASIDDVSCASLGGSSSIGQCENNLEFALNEVGGLFLGISVSDEAEEGTCFCELTSYAEISSVSESVEIVINIVDNGESEEEEEEEENLKVAIAIGETETVDVDMMGTNADTISCASLGGSSSIGVCDDMLSFMVWEYMEGYTGPFNIDVSVSETASEGTCFCELTSYSGETKELTIDIVDEGIMEVDVNVLLENE